VAKLLAGAVALIALGACGSTSTRSVQSPAPAHRVSAAPTSHSGAPPLPLAPPAPQPPRPHGAPEAAEPLFGIGNVRGCLGGGDPVPYLRKYRAAVLRVVVTPLWGGLGSNGEALPCIRDARDAGYRVHLVIQYSNVWTTEQAVAYFRQVLSYYGRFAWAVSVGSEQELFQGGVGKRGRQYAEAWRALEPVVAELAPQAIRVAGEISPWGLSYLKGAVRAGLPGAQVVAAHVYTYPFHFRIPVFEAWARAVRLPYWFTEGAYVAGSKAPVVPVSELAGAPVIEGWLDY
jgi:hypothetical protein